MYTHSNAVALALSPGSGSISPSDTTVQFYDIDCVDDVYDWLTDTLIPSVFITTDHTGEPLPDYQLGHLDLANRVLGGVILEMTPREYKSCDSEFVLLELYPNCTYVDDAAKTTVFLDVSLDAAQATAVVEELRTSGTWVNYHSKELAVTVATYSGEVSVFTVTRSNVHFLQTGLIWMDSSTDSIPDYRGRTWKTIIPVVAAYIVFGLILRRLENARPRTPAQKLKHSTDRLKAKKQTNSVERRKALIKQYSYTAGEFCVKFGALPTFAVLWTVTISLNFDDKLLELPAAKSLDEEYRDTVAVIDALDKVAAWTNALSIARAIAVLQLGLYTIRQLSFHPQLNVFARTVRHSLYQFRAFFLVFLIIFITFSFMGNLLFGDRVHEFSTAALSRDSCMNILFGTFEFGTIYNIRGSGWFFWGYMIIVSLILLNMMLAIVMGTYKTMNKEGYQGEINVKLASRISTFHRYFVQYVIATYRGYRYRTEHHENDSAKDVQASRMSTFSRCVVQCLKAGLRELFSLAEHENSEKDLARDFDALIPALQHDAVIAYGKIRPPQLLAMLKTVVKYDPTAPSKMLNHSFLRSTLFPAAGLSEKEILETFEFLNEGFVLDEAVTRQGRAKELASNQSKGARLDELQQNLKALMEQVNATHKEIQALTG
jgi:hypothetical protein